MYTSSKGFTLIELLVVIAIIGLLSSVIIAPIQTSRKKARDARKMSDLKAIQTALYMYFDDNGAMPGNPNPCCGAVEGSAEYNTVMQSLVTGGYLQSIPKSPLGSWANGGYAYYNYGGPTIGALMVTTLEAAQANTDGVPPSCRPWASGQNWCDQSVNKYYCICSPY